MFIFGKGHSRIKNWKPASFLWEKNKGKNTFRVQGWRYLSVPLGLNNLKLKKKMRKSFLFAIKNLNVQLSIIVVHFLNRRENEILGDGFHHTHFSII